MKLPTWTLLIIALLIPWTSGEVLAKNQWETEEGRTALTDKAIANQQVLKCCSGENRLLELVSHSCSEGHLDDNFVCSGGGMYVEGEGTFYNNSIFVKNGLLLQGDDVIDDVHFCVTHYRNSSSYVAMVCFNENTEEIKFNSINSICCFVSIVCFFVTILVYLIVPQLRDLQGKCLITMMTCQLLSFSFLTFVQGNNFIVADNFCMVLGFILYFWLVASFLWLNVVTVNIWRTIRFPELTTNERHLFLFYNAYAWGLTILVTAIAWLADNLPGEHYRPNFGITKCWFHTDLENWVFFYGPVSLILIINILLYGDIFYTLWGSWFNDSKSNTVKAFRQKFLLCLKIFFITGILWIFEPVSALFLSDDGSFSLWVITDILNSSQGLLIFILLVLRRPRAMRHLARRTICGFRFLPINYATMDDWETEVQEVNYVEESKLSEAQAAAADISRVDVCNEKPTHNEFSNPSITVP